MKRGFLNLNFAILIVNLFSFISIDKISSSDCRTQLKTLDTIWKATPIAKLNDPAPGGGNFEEFGSCYILESGYLVFWGRHGKSERKDWSLYSYKEGEIKRAFNTFEKFTLPDGISKEFYYAPAAIPNKSSNKLLYLSAGSGSMGSWDHVYGFNGEQLMKIVGEGDRIRITANREVIVNKVRLESITNSEGAIIFFNSEKPNKVKGWLLHDGRNLTPLFIADDELPGMPGVNIKGLVVEGTWRDKVYIFNDTILANLYIAGGSSRQGIFRITRDKTELIEAMKGINPISLPHAADGDNFIIKSKDIFHYKNGKRNFILENKKEIPSKDQFLESSIVAYGIAGPEKESLVIAAGGNPTRLYLYHNNKLSVYDPIQFSPFDPSTSPLMTRSMIMEAKWAQLKTAGPEQFDITDIIGPRNEKKMFAMYTPFFAATAIYELTK